MNDVSAAELWSMAVLRWRQGRRSFDARSLKERRLIVIAVLAVSWLLADTVWITPGYKALLQARAQLSAARSELANAQQAQAAQTAEMLRMTQNIQAELAAVQRRLQDKGAAFAQAEQVLVPARQMRELLKGLLSEQQRLQLVSMKTLAAQPVTLTPGQGEGTALYRHGLEIRVSGGFHDLLNWLLSIEALPRKVLWDSLKLESDEHSRLVLTIRVQTLSRDAEPMEIAS